MLTIYMCSSIDISVTGNSVQTVLEILWKGTLRDALPAYGHFQGVT